MKKIIAFLLAATMMFALGTSVFASGGGTFHRPGVANTSYAGFDVAISGPGGGSNATLTVSYGGEIVFTRPESGGTRLIQVVVDEVVLLYVDIQGNSIVGVWLPSGDGDCDDPYIVEEYSFYRFVDYNQVDSYFVGTSEVEDTRDFVVSAVVANNWERSNRIPGVNGQGVLVGARVTGTLTYEYVRNYVEQFERVYEWVDVTVWSDDTRDEVVREDSEHVRGYLVDGDEYYTGPYAGSSPITATTSRVILHMGNGQSSAHSRFATATVGGITVNFELLNTGNNVRNTVITIYNVDLDAL